MIVIEGGRNAFNAASGGNSMISNVSDEFINSLSGSSLNTFNRIMPELNRDADKLRSVFAKIDDLRDSGMYSNTLDLYPVTSDEALLWPSGIMQQIIMSHPGIFSTGIKYDFMDVFDNTSGNENIFYREVMHGAVTNKGYTLNYTRSPLSDGVQEAMQNADMNHIRMTFDYLDGVMEDDIFSDILDMNTEWL